MRAGDALLVGDTPLTFVEHPLYASAHPGEDCDPTERCTKCALARRSDTGEVVLLWQCEGKNWTVSRHDPEWARHREEIHNLVATDNRMAA
jgi:hypothetical protein